MDSDKGLGDNVLLTGGTGFLGRGILRRASREKWDTRFTIYSRDEQKQDVCKWRYPDAHYVIGDIIDTERLTLAMLNHSTVIHAAAFKYVPEAERAVSECVRINVAGTQSVIRAAMAAKVKTLVFISTDKAVEPVNVYGLTKALGERMAVEASRHYADTGLRVVACRYGNVIGSTGSVIPLLQRQAREKGRVTLTDGSMTRFWISVDQAVDLITYCACSALNGCIVVPNPYAMRMHDLALVVAPDAPIEIIGMRPGEKYHEKLLTRVESLRVDPPRVQKYHVIADHPPTFGVEVYELSSERAGTMHAEAMRELIADAADV